MHIGFKRELERANEALERVQEEVTEVKELLADLLQEEELQQPVAEKQLQETGQKNINKEQKPVRL